MAIFVNETLVEFGKYPNGESIVPALPERPMDDATVVRLHWTGDHDLLQLALVRGLLNQRDPRGVVYLYIDYMPYSRMDREQDGHCFSLKYIAEQINQMYFHKVYVVEPHSQVTLDLLDHSKPIWATAKMIPTVMQMMGFDVDHDFIVIPDAGAAKRYVIPGANMVVLKKSRDFATGKITGLEVDHRIICGYKAVSGYGAKALIIDDLSSRGGTFVAAAELLRETFGFTYVALLVTHMEPAGRDGDLRRKLDRVYCTDTMEFPRPLPSNFELMSRSSWL